MSMLEAKIESLHADLDYWQQSVEYWSTFCDGYPLDSAVEECNQNIAEIEKEIEALSN